MISFKFEKILEKNNIYNKKIIFISIQKIWILFLYATFENKNLKSE